MTYSFPCQDLSLAGKRKGMSDNSTRSGLLWEVERILDECKELPQILLMENVPQVIGTGNVEHFNKWQLKLEQLGYKNYHQNLIATDYGIPQTRNRTFMVSILGNYSYTFPKPIPLKLKLKDMLEDEVDEKYYLSEDKIHSISHWKAYQKPFEKVQGKNSICPTLTARGAGEEHSGMITYSDYLEDTTNLQNELIGLFDDTSSDNFAKGKRDYGYRKEYGTLKCTPKYSIYKNTDLRIRKLTPREAFRLMGVKDEDYDKLTCSDSQKYKQAGNSIVVNVLMAIFKELLGE
jgi:DNA (cytosine-5)-methyltransferase 1